MTNIKDEGFIKVDEVNGELSEQMIDKITDKVIEKLSNKLVRRGLFAPLNVNTITTTHKDEIATFLSKNGLNRG